MSLAAFTGSIHHFIQSSENPKTTMKNFLGIGILVVRLVAESLTLDTRNDVNRDALNTTDIGTLMDSLCFGQGSLGCACPSLSDPKINRKEIDCNGLNITQLPFWNETKDSRLDGPVSVLFERNRLKRILSIDTSDVIEALSFDGNVIEALSPYAFQGLVNLKVLSISGNRLDKIGHHDLQTSKSSDGLVLEELDLSDNFLVHVDDDAFEQLPMLRILRMSNNPIHMLDLSTIQALNSVHGLRVLRLSHTQLTSLPPKQLVNPLRSLQELDLSYNRLTEVPEALQNAEHLLRLNLDGNPINELDVMSFVGLVSLDELDINNMTNLEVILGGTFTPLAKLTQLRCSDNVKLSGIETEAFFDRHGHHGTKSLKTIKLNDNNLSVFNQETFARMPYVTMELEGNPLHCSCHVAWLNASHGNLRCATPASLNGTLLKDVDFSKAPCDDYSHDGMEPHTRMVYMGLVVSLGFLTLILVAGSVLMIARRAKSPYPNAHYRRAQNNEACDLYNE